MPEYNSKKDDTNPLDVIAGRDALDELADSQRRRVAELKLSKKLGTGVLPTPTTRRSGDAAPNRGPADFLARLGATYTSLGRAEHAIEFYQQALDGFRGSHDRENEAMTLNNLAKAFWQQADIAKAIESFENAAQVYHALNQPRGEASALNCIGLCHEQGGDLDAALGFYERALAILWDAGDVAGEAATLDVIGMAYRKLGRTKDALDAHKQALEKHRQQSDKSGEASGRHAMALVYEEMGQPEKAIAFYEWALAIRREVVDRPGEAITCYNLSKLYARLNHLVEAEALLARCVEIEEQTGHADLAKDEAELADLRERRRRAGLPAPSGDTSGKMARIARDDPYANQAAPLDLTRRSRPVRKD